MISTVPPRLDRTRRRRQAALLNLLLPGAGQWYLGQRAAGVLLATTFLAACIWGCVLAVRGVALVYRAALSDSESNWTSALAASQPGRIIVAFGIAVVIFLIAQLALILAPRN
jgi:hypothetical protein